MLKTEIKLKFLLLWLKTFYSELEFYMVLKMS